MKTAGKKDGQTEGQTLIHRILPATAGDPIRSNLLFETQSYFGAKLNGEQFFWFHIKFSVLHLKILVSAAIKRVEKNCVLL